MKGKTCPSDTTAYEAIITCDGIRNHQTVNRFSYGSLSCDSIPKNFSGYPYCFVGVTANAGGNSDSLLDLYERLGMCQ